MREIWLRNNARAAWFGALPPVITLLLVGILTLGPLAVTNRWLQAGGALLAAVALVVLLSAVWQARRPRLAYELGFLLVYLRPQAPWRVPIDDVEGFLLGQGPSFLPGKRYVQAEVANLIVRLAERADEWRTIEIDRRLGTWCGHYITIRGTWCEPLNVKVANRLNARLAEVKQGRRTEAAA
jgi:hypothetical protein